MMARAKDTNANKEVAQLIPSWEYMGLVAKGRQTAMVDRMVLAAAWADAEYCL